MRWHSFIFVLFYGCCFHGDSSSALGSSRAGFGVAGVIYPPSLSPLVPVLSSSFISFLFSSLRLSFCRSLFPPLVIFLYITLFLFCRPYTSVSCNHFCNFLFLFFPSSLSSPSFITSLPFSSSAHFFVSLNGTNNQKIYLTVFMTTAVCTQVII